MKKFPDFDQNSLMTFPNYPGFPESGHPYITDGHYWLQMKTTAIVDIIENNYYSIVVPIRYLLLS